MLFDISSSTDDQVQIVSDRGRILKRMIFLAFLVVAGFLLHLPSELGASLAIPPDSTEYSIGLVNLFEHGKFGFTLNGEWFPSRYSPWFSLSCLAPAYLLFYDVLSLHWAVLAFALAFLVISCRFGRIAGLGKWSFVCAVVPLFIPDFVFYSRMVMTEIPYTAIFAASALVFVRFATCETLSYRLCLGAGTLVAWGGAVRVTALPMLALFAVSALVKKCEFKRKVLLVLILLFPAMAYEIANLMYNRCVFGSCFRSGYQYWLSVPCDYSNLSFNIGYMLDNMGEYLLEPVTLIAFSLAVFILIVACLMLAGRFGGRNKNRNFLLLFGYVLFQGIVLFSLYVGYYWCDVRFFLPVMLCLIPLFLGSVATIVGKIGEIYKCALVIAFAVLCLGDFHFVCPRYFFMARGYPLMIVEAGISREVLPSGSVVVQEGNPSFTDFFGPKGRTVRHFPIFRRFDYVNAMVAPCSIANFRPKPTSYRQRIVPELVKSGMCRLPFPETLSENPERIRHFLEEGRRVFLHLGFASGDDKKIFTLLEGFDVKMFGAWSVPAIDANPLRCIYDRFVFPLFRMDSRPEVRCGYYEILPKRSPCNDVLEVCPPKSS